MSDPIGSRANPPVPRDQNPVRGSGAALWFSGWRAGRQPRRFPGCFSVCRESCRPRRSSGGQSVPRPAQRITDMEQPAHQRGDPGQRPPLVLSPPPRRQASGPARSRSSCAPPSRHTAPPGPLEARVASPPARQRRRHTYAELHETRSRRATFGGSTPPRTTPRPATALPRAWLAQRRTGHHHLDTSYLRVSPASQPCNDDTPSNPTPSKSWQFNFCRELAGAPSPP